MALESGNPAELMKQGYQARREGRHADAKAAYAEAVELGRGAVAAGDGPAVLALALTGLGGIERDLRKVEAALKHYQEAVALYRTGGDPLALAHTVRHVGDILRGAGQLEAALPCYNEALAIYREQPETDALDLANALRGFALLQSATGDTLGAIMSWREAGALYDRVWREPDSPFSEADLAPGVAESARQIAMLTAAT